jgi:hypothetical protein
MPNNFIDPDLEFYQNSNKKQTKKMTEEELKQRYFTPILPKGKKEAEYRIRLLPGKDGAKTFSNIWFHEIELPNAANGYKSKLYDPAKNEGKRSPLTEVYEELMKQDPTRNKELAKKYLPKEFYIAKVIDRENESDGPKFWRFKKDLRSQGVMDKIMAIWKSKGVLSDPEKGRDLTIKVMAMTNPQNGSTYTSVVSIIQEDVEPLHTDKDLAQAWLDDPTTWEDVYSKKPVEYLEAIARGETPRWDSNQNKYVYGNSSEAEESFGGAVKEPEVDIQADDEPFEELPF